MKRTILLVLVAAVLATMQAAVKVDRIEPTDWYVGLIFMTFFFIVRCL